MELDINGVSLAPTLAPGPDLNQFVADGVVGGLLVDRGAIDGATVRLLDDQAGPICTTPTSVSLGASEPTDPIGGAATVFANSHPATDTAVRPSATGVDQWLQVRGPTAPQQFSWHVDLQPTLELRRLSNGSVAVVRPAQPGWEGYGLEDPPAEPSAAQREAAAANTDLHLTQAENDLANDQGSTADDILAVYRPAARNAQGAPVATSLNATGSTLTMTVPHSVTTAYPLYPSLGLTSSDQIDDAGSARVINQENGFTRPVKEPKQCG